MLDRAAARGRRLRFALWGTLCCGIVVWVLLLWHPWIDWFGRPR